MAVPEDVGVGAYRLLLRVWVGNGFRARLSVTSLLTPTGGPGLPLPLVSSDAPIVTQSWPAGGDQWVLVDLGVATARGTVEFAVKDTEGTYKQGMVVDAAEWVREGSIGCVIGAAVPGGWVDAAKVGKPSCMG